MRRRGPSLADVRRFLRTWEGLLLVLLIVIVAANAISVQGYLQPQNQVNLLRSRSRRRSSRW